MQLIVHTDGGARGNPGPAAIGVVVQESDGKVVKEIGARIGKATNNVAEYSAVIVALEYIKTLGEGHSVDIFLDSTLVTNQINGLYKVKEPHLRTLLLKVRMLEQSIGGVIMYHSVPREQNTHADLLVNQALDEPNSSS